MKIYPCFFHYIHLLMQWGIIRRREMNTDVWILGAVGFWLSTFLFSLSKYLWTPVSQAKLLHSKSMHNIFAHHEDEIVTVPSLHVSYRRHILHFVQYCRPRIMALFSVWFHSYLECLFSTRTALSSTGLCSWDSLVSAKWVFENATESGRLYSTCSWTTRGYVK